VTPQDLARLIDAHAAALVLLARTICQSPEDAVQEAFVELAGLRTAPENPPAWLFRAVRHRALNQARAARRRRHHEAGAAAAGSTYFVATIDDTLDANAAAGALAELPEDERQIVVMKIWGGRTFAEIGEILGFSDSTAQRRYAAALENLRERMRGPCPAKSETKT
jgi:RNA polymerase sigma-70 factor (ECF subfamily)